MLKIIGCILVFTCCSMAGYIKAVSYRQRTIELEKVIEILKLIEMEITYKKEPLAKTYQKVSVSKKCWFSESLALCSLGLRQHASLGHSWDKALKETKNKCPLEYHDVEILTDLMSSIGKTDSDGQVKVIKPTMIRLKSSLEDSRMKESRLGKMYKALGTAAGIVLVIMLI